MKYWIIILTLMGCIPNDSGAAVYNINNEQLSVGYDDATETFSVTEIATGKCFLMDGKLEGVSRRATVNLARDAVFGEGRKIVVTQTDGSTASLELYDRLPFVLVRKELHNNGEVTTDF